MTGAIKKISKDVISLNDPATEDSNSQPAVLSDNFQEIPSEEVVQISLEETVTLSDPDQVLQPPHVLPDHQDFEVNLGVVLLAKATHTTEKDTADQAAEPSKEPIEKANPTVEEETVEEPPERENPTPLDQENLDTAKVSNDDEDLDASHAKPGHP